MNDLMHMDTRDSKITIRIKEEDKELLQGKAKERGITLSELINRILDGFIKV
jgi:predicted DNA binding CopG/RHH family protein